MILMIHAYVNCSKYVNLDFVRFMMYQCDNFIMIDLYHYTLYWPGTWWTLDNWRIGWDDFFGGFPSLILRKLQLRHASTKKNYVVQHAQQLQDVFPCKEWFCKKNALTYCWWFRNPKQPPFWMVLKPCKKNRIKLPTSTGYCSRISEPSTVCPAAASRSWRLWCQPATGGSFFHQSSNPQLLGSNHI